MWFIVFHRSWLQTDANCADESIRAFRIVASLTMLWACVAGQASRSQCLDHLDQRFIHHMQKLPSTIRGLLLLWSPLNYLQWWFWNFEDCTTGWATTKKCNMFIDFSEISKVFHGFSLWDILNHEQKNRTLFHIRSQLAQMWNAGSYELAVYSPEALHLNINGFHRGQPEGFQPLGSWLQIFQGQIFKGRFFNWMIWVSS